MKIVFIASECTPYVKTGGLADVVGALPRALQALGHEVVVILPRYAAIDGSRFGLEPFLSPMGVWMGNAEEWCAVQVADPPHDDSVENEPTVYFIESQKYFNRYGLYHDADFHDYLDYPRPMAYMHTGLIQEDLPKNQQLVKSGQVLDVLRHAD